MKENGREIRTLRNNSFIVECVHTRMILNVVMREYQSFLSSRFKRTFTRNMSTSNRIAIMLVKKKAVHLLSIEHFPAKLVDTFDIGSNAIII